MPIVQATPQTIADAARLLQAGGLVAFPTETVYGLGADATDGVAVARIYEAKGRPRFNPLIAHVTDLASAARIAVIDGASLALARAFWPGSLTLVVPLRADSPISALVTAGLDTIAVRVPSHAIARAILHATGRPVAAPSANISGRVSPTRAEHVAVDLGDMVDLIIDGGPCASGLESTIVDATGGEPVLLRPGAVAAEAIERVLGMPLRRHAAGNAIPDAPTSPGQLASHYAPTAAVRLDVTTPRMGEALLAFGPHPPPHGGPVVNLSPTGDLREAAARLFAALRELDAAGVASIAVMPIPATGLGEAIVDRLRRAAAPRR